MSARTVYFLMQTAVLHKLLCNGMFLHQSETKIAFDYYCCYYLRMLYRINICLNENNYTDVNMFPVNKNIKNQ